MLDMSVASDGNNDQMDRDCFGDRPALNPSGDTGYLPLGGSTWLRMGRLDLLIRRHYPSLRSSVHRRRERQVAMGQIRRAAVRRSIAVEKWLRGGWEECDGSIPIFDRLDVQVSQIDVRQRLVGGGEPFARRKLVVSVIAAARRGRRGRRSRAARARAARAG